MSRETTDNQKLSFRVATFIFIIFSVASMSFTISGIIGEIGETQEDLVDEEYARRKNDKAIKEEIKELKNTIKFILDSDAIN
jgi:hypothetical protein